MVYLQIIVNHNSFRVKEIGFSARSSVKTAKTGVYFLAIKRMAAAAENRYNKTASTHNNRNGVIDFV